MISSRHLYLAQALLPLSNLKCSLVYAILEKGLEKALMLTVVKTLRSSL
jgi:hypothetical protein